MATKPTSGPLQHSAIRQDSNRKVTLAEPERDLGHTGVL
jgi:hypothetical protein